MSKDTRPYLPPEWSPQSCVWAGWPYLRGEWGWAFDGARAEIASFLRALCTVTPVKVACGSREAYGSAWAALEPEIVAQKIQVHTVPAGDIWVRDTGPLIGCQGKAPLALQFRFNGWGGKFDMRGDTLTAGGLASVEGLARRQHDFVLEGGALDWDGTGRVLTTRQCVLNSNRQNGWFERDAEQTLNDALGMDTVHWLDEGLIGDHTDGHIDNIARFIGPGRVVCQHASGENDPNAERLKAVELCLRDMGLEVVTIPSPGRILDADKTIMPASHMNFLMSNGHVFLPIYDTEIGHGAAAALQHALPHFEIVPLVSTHILAGGGSFHCMTQQVPNV